MAGALAYAAEQLSGKYRDDRRCEGFLNMPIDIRRRGSEGHRKSKNRERMHYGCEFSNPGEILFAYNAASEWRPASATKSHQNSLYCLRRHRM